MLSIRHYGLILLGILSIVLFTVYSPVMDKYIANLTYSAVSNTFYGTHCKLCSLIYSLVPVITVGLILVSGGLFFTTKRRAATIMLIALLLGPGLVINTLCKDHWGRARPYQVLRHQAKFTPVWQADFHEPENNSFASGHASIGFFLGIPFFVLGRKRTGLAVSLVAGGIIGLVRIMQGGHYLSDVVFAGLLVWSITFLILWLSTFVCMDSPSSGE